MRSNCAASSLSNNGSNTNSVLGRDWLGEGANLEGWDADINELLSQIARIELIWLLLGMFYKCRLKFRQTGMIFGENAMKVTNLEGLQNGGSRLGQSVSILMNWRTGFEKRGQ